MFSDLTPVFTIGGMAVTTWLVEHALNATGHGDKVIFTRVLGYAVGAVYTFTTWFAYVHKVASMFHVFL